MRLKEAAMAEGGGDAEVTFYQKQQVAQGRLSCKYCKQTMDDHRIFERHMLQHSDSALWRQKNKNDADENSVPWFALRGADDEEPELSTDPLIFTDPVAMESIARQLAGLSFRTRFHRCSRASSGVCTDRFFCITSTNQASIATACTLRRPECFQKSEQCRWLCQQCGYAISRLPFEVVVLLALAHMFKKHAVEEREELLEQWNSFNHSFGVNFKLDNDPAQPALIFDDFLPHRKEARFLEECLQQSAYHRKRFLLCTKCMELHETATQFITHLADEHGVRECQQFFAVSEERTVSGDLFPLTPQWFPLAVVTTTTASFSWQCFGCDEKLNAECFVGLVVKTTLHVIIRHADDLRFLSSLHRLADLLRTTNFDGIRKKLAAAKPLVSTESVCLKEPRGEFKCEFCQETFPRLVASGSSDQCAHIILRHQPILDCPGALRYLFAQRTTVESEPPYLKVSCSGYVNGSAGNKVFCAKCSYQASSFEQLLRHADDSHSDAPKVDVAECFLVLPVDHLVEVVHESTKIEAISMHQVADTEDSCLVCVECGFATFKTSAARRHITECTPCEFLSAQVEPQNTQQTVALGKKYVRRTGSPSNTCETCGETVAHLLQHHLHSHFDAVVADEAEPLRLPTTELALVDVHQSLALSKKRSLPTIVCRHCSRFYADMKELAVHAEQEHTSDKPKNDPVESTVSMRELKKIESHLLAVAAKESDEKIECILCDSKMVKQRPLCFVLHLLRHHLAHARALASLQYSEAPELIKAMGLDVARATAERPFACFDCRQSSFTEYKYLKTHRARNCQLDEFGQRRKAWAPSQPQTCEYCDKELGQKKKLDKGRRDHLQVVHILQVHLDKVDSIDGEQLRNEFPYLDVSVATRKYPFVCARCGHRSKTHAAFMRHAHSVKDEESHSCTCGEHPSRACSRVIMPDHLEVVTKCDLGEKLAQLTACVDLKNTPKSAAKKKRRKSKQAVDTLSALLTKDTEVEEIPAPTTSSARETNDVESNVFATPLINFRPTKKSRRSKDVRQETALTNTSKRCTPRHAVEVLDDVPKEVEERDDGDAVGEPDFIESVWEEADGVMETSTLSDSEPMLPPRSTSTPKPPPIFKLNRTQLTPFSCDKCGASMKRKNALNKHYRRFHLTDAPTLKMEKTLQSRCAICERTVPPSTRYPAEVSVFSHTLKEHLAEVDGDLREWLREFDIAYAFPFIDARKSVEVSDEHKAIRLACSRCQRMSTDIRTACNHAQCHIVLTGDGFMTPKRELMTPMKMDLETPSTSRMAQATPLTQTPITRMPTQSTQSTAASEDATPRRTHASRTLYCELCRGYSKEKADGYDERVSLFIHLLRKHSRETALDYAEENEVERLFPYIDTERSTRDAVFACQHCDYATNRFEYLAQHMWRISAKTEPEDESTSRTYRCDVCGFTADKPRTLTLHHKQFHEAASGKERKAFSCDQCAFSTKWKAALAKHWSKFHSTAAAQDGQD